MNFFRFTSLFIASFSLSPAVAQIFNPDPVFDCTEPNFRVIYTACSAGDYSQCCAVGTSCCAGGCCDLTSTCLNVGTSNEVCCEATDPNFCGYYKGSGTTPPYAVQSVACTGSDGLSSYYCPPGATCDSFTDSCIGGSSGGGGNSIAPPAASSSSSPAPSPSPSPIQSPVPSPEPETSETPIASPPPQSQSSMNPEVNSTPTPQISVATVTVQQSSTAQGNTPVNTPTGGNNQETPQATVTVTSAPKNDALRGKSTKGFLSKLFAFFAISLLVL
ncbi:hypothetical protein TWF694_007673 [Orbilia ellipsospora]|uniref:Uncharacterized protein n=1 Tax=Orbilia ellipsospora TaxID=2528407 RepID=A0AAV9XK48_9PEZI